MQQDLSLKLVISIKSALEDARYEVGRAYHCHSDQQELCRPLRAMQ